ncbi:protocadherin-8-like [Osmerus eperlanus]|uniref:protocadherin-8-like n=1 Tax=Osmerus eperlanus TaxID=29151 RepID=UPI002E15773E
MEEDERGTEIGILKKDLEIGESGSRFRFIEQPNICLINMREVDGQLSIGQRLDREELCHRSPHCMLPLDVVASYNDSFHLIHVVIEVRDINDHSPLFPVTDTYIEVIESASLGTRFPIEIASDKDIGQNDIQNYYISSNNHFNIKEQTDEGGDRYAYLMIVTELDRETEDTFTILVMAMDGGSPPKSGILTVHVKIVDFNDNSPSFVDDFVSVDVYEDRLVGVLISQLNATDPDEGKNGEIMFAFAEHTPADIQNIFTIDSFTGRLVLAGEVDFEITPFYEFKIKAFDLGLNSVPAVCTVRINILDVNDNFPLIFIKPFVFDKVVYISEHAAEGSFVAVISTMDSDSGLNGQVRCFLQGHEHFRLQKANESNTHIIMTTTHLDRETQDEYNLTFVAMDFGTPQLKTTTEYTVRVSDENDNTPLFNKVVYEVWVEENNIVGAFIMSVLAFDPDLGQNADITYKLTDDQSNTIFPSTQYVSINPLSGSLYALETFDYEQIKDIKLKVQASDSGYPELSTTALVWIRIVDKNDCPPVITYPRLVNGVAFAFWATDASSDIPVMRIKAQDADEGLNAELKFLILEDARKLFAVNERTGSLYLQGKQCNPSEKILQESSW